MDIVVWPQYVLVVCYTVEGNDRHHHDHYTFRHQEVRVDICKRLKVNGVQESCTGGNGSRGYYPAGREGFIYPQEISNDEYKLHHRERMIHRHIIPCSKGIDDRTRLSEERNDEQCHECFGGFIQQLPVIYTCRRSKCNGQQV